MLPGTTQADAFRWFARQGITTQVRSIRVDELPGAQAACFTSGSRFAAPVRELNGPGLVVDRGLTGRLNDFLLGRND